MPAAPQQRVPLAARKRLVAGLLLVVAVGMLARWWYLRRPTAPTEIFQGVTYGCDEMPDDAESRGLVHWVKVDLSAPGIELYVTPLDPSALAHGWQYRLQTTPSVVRRQRLAVAVNACLFTSDSGWVPLPGDLARSVETVVADRQANHLWEHTYLLWFDDELTPTLETTKPPSEDVLSRARWGVGGQGVGLREGRPRPGQSSEQADARTAVGIDRERRLLFLAVFESATPWRALDKLAALGAREGMLLDGGSSTSMVLGDGASGVRSGSLMGGWRPVATHFGVRARPLPPAAPSSG